MEHSSRLHKHLTVALQIDCSCTALAAAQAGLQDRQQDISQQHLQTGTLHELSTGNHNKTRVGFCCLAILYACSQDW